MVKSAKLLQGDQQFALHLLNRPLDVHKVAPHQDHRTVVEPGDKGLHVRQRLLELGLVGGDGMLHLRDLGLEPLEDPLGHALSRALALAHVALVRPRLCEAGHHFVEARLHCIHGVGSLRDGIARHALRDLHLVCAVCGGTRRGCGKSAESGGEVCIGRFQGSLGVLCVGLHLVDDAAGVCIDPVVGVAPELRKPPWHNRQTLMRDLRHTRVQLEIPSIAQCLNKPHLLGVQGQHSAARLGAQGRWDDLISQAPHLGESWLQSLQDEARHALLVCSRAVALLEDSRHKKSGAMQLLVVAHVPQHLQHRVLLLHSHLQ
mmetsp:Transcript_43039/g.128546  ORF Transcript_43039/g.128546 Transcript_43039/m.128546 type:complete len:317 (+) Transcript_43039:375-1325(+)